MHTQLAQLSATEPYKVGNLVLVTMPPYSNDDPAALGDVDFILEYDPKFQDVVSKAIESRDQVEITGSVIQEPGKYLPTLSASSITLLGF